MLVVRYLFLFVMVMFFVRVDQAQAIQETPAEHLCRYLLMPRSENETEFAAETIKSTLSKTQRKIWQKRGIPDYIGETVWDHSQKVTQALTKYCEDHPALKCDHARAIILIQNYAEHRFPDSAPMIHIDRLEKQVIEENAIYDLAKLFGPKGINIRSLWVEYENLESQEARIVYQLDNLDVGVQALEYEKSGYNLDEIFENVKPHLREPELKQIYEFLLSKRMKGLSFYDLYFELLGLSGRPSRLKSFMRDY
jgi:5'-deoxynucleotidase YfbR-like HD superfamily hydrolase